jgi:hypothetical protein
VFFDLDLCLEFDLLPYPLGAAPVMKRCSAGNDNQRIYYDAETLQIKLSGSGYCFDYNFSFGNVIMRLCSDLNNQKWYHERSTNRLRSLYDSKCLEWGSTSLSMQTCDNGANQMFLVPSLWFGRRSKAIRLSSDYNKCMAYDPDQSNNVFMTDCQGEGLDQHFDYDPSSQEINQDGLCLDQVVSGMLQGITWYSLSFTVGNVLMLPCSGADSQKWLLLGNIRIKSVESGSCLRKKNNNIELASCTDTTTSNQTRFVFPESWTMPAQQAASVANNQYYSHSLPPAIWSSEVCVVDWLKDATTTCDDSMALLVGSSTSVGTLRDVAKLVNENGPDRMPGTCCLDTPLTSQYFGYHVSYGVKVRYHLS